MASEQPGHVALAAIDKALAGKPNKDGTDFAHAAMCLAAFRDRLIERHRAHGDAREELARLNGIISVVMGAQFPLGKIPWDEVEKARGALAGLVDAV